LILFLVWGSAVGIGSPTLSPLDVTTARRSGGRAVDAVLDLGIGRGDWIAHAIAAGCRRQRENQEEEPSVLFLISGSAVAISPLTPSAFDTEKIRIVARRVRGITGSTSRCWSSAR
jgi:hypothetical protein